MKQNPTLVKSCGEFLGESPTWQSLGHIYRHGPEFLLVTHVWVCRTLACRSRTSTFACWRMVRHPTSGWEVQRWRPRDSGTKGSHWITRPGLSSFCNDARVVSQQISGGRFESLSCQPSGKWLVAVQWDGEWKVCKWFFYPTITSLETTQNFKECLP